MKGTKTPKLEFNVKPQKAYLKGDFLFIDLQIITPTPTMKPWQQAEEGVRYGARPVKKTTPSRDTREKFIWNLLGLPEEVGPSNRWRAIAILPRALMPGAGRFHAAGSLRLRLKSRGKRFSTESLLSMKRGSRTV